MAAGWFVEDLEGADCAVGRACVDDFGHPGKELICAVVSGC